MTDAALKNAMTCVVASGGSTNGVLHLPAIANELGLHFSLDEINAICARTPLLCDLKPGGRFMATDFFRAGGTKLLGHILAEAGLLNKGCLTVTGKTIGDESERIHRAAGTGSDSAGRARTESDGRTGDSAWQLVARRLRGEAGGPRTPRSSRSGASLRERRAGVCRSAEFADQLRRCHRDSQRRAARRSGHARDAGRNGCAGGDATERARCAADRRTLLRRDPRIHDRARRARSRGGRTDCSRARRRHHSHRRRQRPVAIGSFRRGIEAPSCELGGSAAAL